MAVKRKKSDKNEAGNAFRNKGESPSRSGRKKESSQSKQSRSGAFVNFILMRTESSRRFFGALFLLFSAYTFLSFTSFLFSWKEDASLVGMPFQDWINSEPGTARNWMGMIGARTALFFMYKGIGLAALVIPVFFFRLGLKYFLSRDFNIQLFLARTLPLVFLVPFSLALPFGQFLPVLAGGLGIEWLELFRALIGWIGSLILALTGIFLYLLLAYGLNLYEVFRNRVFKSNKIPLSDNAGVETDDDSVKTETLFEKDNIELDEEEQEEDEISADDLVLEIRDTNEESEETVELENIETDQESDLELQIEVPKEDEEADVETTRMGIDTVYDPTLDLSTYRFPELDFLKDYGENNRSEVSAEELERSKKLIVDTLKNYKIEIDQIRATIGPTVTLFEIVPAPGVKISKIRNLEDDIALSLAALGIRIIAPIPGKGTIGIEVPNKKREVVSMRTVIKSKAYQESKFDLPVCLGKSISNEVFVADLARMPHLLMAGATGQGKSVGLNALIVSLLYKKHPSELKFVLVDPKKVELTLYNALERHYLAKLPGEADAIITDNKQVIHTLNSLTVEMDNRYALLQAALVRNISEYNQKFIKRKLNPNEGHRFLPFIVVIIDEVADLIMTAGKEVEHPIGRLAQLARAIGIHLVLATQRPSVNIITGTIKANFPARVAFRVTSKVDSRTILDASGADQLIGKGDLLYSDGSNILRLQCPFVDTPEVEEITQYIGNQKGYGSAYLLPEVDDPSGESGNEEFDPDDRDQLFEDAARLVVLTQQGSTSLLQRKLKIGYNRAGRLIDQLEHANIVGPFEGSKAREVLIRDEMSLEQYLNNL